MLSVPECNSTNKIVIVSVYRDLKELSVGFNRLNE